MKKSILMIAFMIVGMTVNAQMTKKLKFYEFESGLKVEIGSVIHVESGSHPDGQGQFLWFFEGKKKTPIPESRFGSEYNGRVFMVDRVLLLRGIANKDESIVVSFRDDDKVCYIFVKQAVESGEIKIY